MTKSEIALYLEEHESAPSALCLVKAIYEGRNLTDEECTEIYEQCEGFNVSEKVRILDLLTLDQLAELSFELKHNS